MAAPTVGDIVFWLTRISTPSGNNILHVTIPASAATVQAIGQQSGRVWTLESGASTQTIVAVDGQTRVVNVSRNETYVAESGETLRLSASLRIHVQGDGTVIAQSEERSCR
ncbi:MAG TPA: hypothetical protein VMM18_02950 [Gemmatimonadaceae bacterium]|nr:hypothetical protein [Gemmatimonadaceae bacterium]